MISSSHQKPGFSSPGITFEKEFISFNIHYSPILHLQGNPFSEPPPWLSLTEPLNPGLPGLLTSPQCGDHSHLFYSFPIIYNPCTLFQIWRDLFRKMRVTASPVTSFPQLPAGPAEGLQGLGLVCVFSLHRRGAGLGGEQLLFNYRVCLQGFNPPRPWDL